MRKMTAAATPTAVTKDEQWSVIRFLMLQNVSSSEILVKCVWRIVCRMLSQNQL